MDLETSMEGLMKEGVERLVTEIDRALAVIERLGRKNLKLKNQLNQLQEKLAQQESDLSVVRSDRDRLQKIYETNAPLINNKENIQQKIELMLSRLDAVNAEFLS